MRKEVTFVLFIIFLEGCLIIPLVNTNPISVDLFSSGQIAPMDGGAIYFRSEEVNISISDEVAISAKYFLKNSENSAANITVALPFSGSPSNLSLFIQGIQPEYVWTELSINYTSGHNYTDPAIAFNLSFTPNEEIMIEANYKRGYSQYSDLKCYAYITQTGRYWGMPIEYAVFELRIDLALIHVLEVNGFENHTSTIDYLNGEIVLFKEFYNWTPIDNIAVILDFTNTPSIPGFQINVIICGVLLGLVLLRHTSNPKIHKILKEPTRAPSHRTIEFRV
jgi:hypothetical protein